VNIDPNNPVVALCAAGMAMEGDRVEARRLFERAWEIRSDDYDASIAAHFLARHQSTTADTLHWNLLAVHHANVISDGRTAPFMASLYLNLGDSYLAANQPVEALEAGRFGEAALVDVPEGGYRDFVARGIENLQARIAAYSLALK
jgi:hypothetical protein